MRLVVHIELGNDAMRTGQHLARALVNVGGRVREAVGRRAPTESDCGLIHDDNGNKVGWWRVEDDDAR